MKAIDFLENYKEKMLVEKSKNTVEAYMRDLHQFLSFINKDIEDVTLDDINTYKDHLLNRVMTKTVNRKLVSVRQYISFVNNLNVGIKILVDIKLIKIQKQDYIEELLSKNEFDRLIKAAEAEKDYRAVAIFYSFYLTGARISELIQFKIDVLEKDDIPVKGKGEKYRYLFIPDRLKRYINDYLSKRENNSEFVFTNVNNENVMSRQSIHNIIKKYAGISKIKLSKAHAHSFRHLYCFRLLDEGLTLDEVADLAGHSDINTTRIYTRRTKEELNRKIKSL